MFSFCNNLLIPGSGCAAHFGEIIDNLIRPLRSANVLGTSNECDILVEGKSSMIDHALTYPSCRAGF